MEGIYKPDMAADILDTVRNTGRNCVYISFSKVEFFIPQEKEEFSFRDIGYLFMRMGVRFIWLGCRSVCEIAYNNHQVFEMGNPSFENSGYLLGFSGILMIHSHRDFFFL